MERLRLFVSVVLFASAFYFVYQGASVAFAKEAMDTVDYLMLSVACLMFGSLIHKVKKTKKEESKEG